MKKIYVKMPSFGPEVYNSVDILSKVFDTLLGTPKTEPKTEPVTKESVEKFPINNIENYIHRIAVRMNWHPKKVVNYLRDLYLLYPSAAFSLVLREIAVVLDENYEGHISDCEEVYVISMLDGRIHKVPKAHIKNFRNFAAFRTIDDAKIACKILKDELKEMFGGK